MVRRKKYNEDGGLNITDAKSYIAKRFQCEQFCYKAVDPHTRIGWCRKGNCSCTQGKCYKLNNNK